MDKVFISYRRDDAAGYARAIYEELTERFPADSVFMDVDAIEPGLPFDEVIHNAVGQCRVLLVLIGPRWLARGADGRSRLEDERDFVRLEIAAALVRNIRVIPVLLDGTQMPRESELPEPLRGLVWRNAIEVSNSRFNADLARLTEVLTRVLDAPAAPEAAAPRPVATGSAAAASTPAAPQAQAARQTESGAARAGGSRNGARYAAGLAAVALAVLAWVMWPDAAPPSSEGVETDQQRGEQAVQALPGQLDKIQQAQMDQIRRLGTGSESELSPLAALDVDVRPWGVVFGSDRSLQGARDELRRASRNGVADTFIYLRNGYYASVAAYADRGKAELTLAVVRRFRSDAYVTDMGKWCRQPQLRDGYVACQATN